MAVEPKQKQAVPNAPVATRVNRVPAPVAGVNNAPLVNRVQPTIKTLLRARYATLAIIRRNWAKRLVCRAFLERMKMILVRTLVKLVVKDNINMHPATKLAWIAKWVST